MLIWKILRKNLHSLNFRKGTDHLERRIILNFFFLFLFLPPGLWFWGGSLQFILADIIKDSDLTWTSCLPKRRQFSGPCLQSYKSWSDFRPNGRAVSEGWCWTVAICAWSTRYGLYLRNGESCALLSLQRSSWLWKGKSSL